MKISVNKMVKMSVLTALSIVLIILIRFPIIPSASFLVYEPADVPILIGTFIFGPIAGLVITFMVALIQAILLNPNGGWVGFIMHLIATGTLVLVAGIIYKRIHSIKGAILGLLAGCISMTLIMIPANYFFVVNFYGMSFQAVTAYIYSAAIPFNLIKSFVNSFIVLLVYKHIGRVFRGFDNLSSKRRS